MNKSHISNRSTNTTTTNIKHVEKTNTKLPSILLVTNISTDNTIIDREHDTHIPKFPGKLETTPLPDTANPTIKILPDNIHGNSTTHTKNGTIYGDTNTNDFIRRHHPSWIKYFNHEL